MTMGLAAQILAANNSTERHDQYKTPARKVAWKRATEKAWKEHTDKTIELYRAAMGNDWITQFNIECRLGYTRTSSSAFIKKLLFDLKLIERRNKDGAVKYARKLGYEYRWIQNEQK